MKILHNKVAIAIEIYLIGLVIILFNWPNDLTDLLNRNFYYLIIAYIVVGGLFTYGVIAKNIKLFEPITIVTVLYFCIMIIYPVYDIKRGNLTTRGVDTSIGGVKGTLIFIVSYISFYTSYFSKLRFKKENNRKWKLLNNLDNVNNQSLLFSAGIIWVIAFTLCMISRVSSGYSLKYILTLGLNGDVVKDSDSVALLFLSNFNTTMLTAWMYIIIMGKKNSSKIITTLFTLLYVFMGNGRWLMFIFIGAPIVYYYLKRKKSPSFFRVLLATIGMLTVFAIMQAMRTAIQYGSSPVEALLEKGFNIEVFLAPLESDFDTYKNYYGVVHNIPEKMDFLFGKGIFLYTLIMFIPRVLWPDKPLEPIKDVITIAVNEMAMLSGEAFPNLGEYYYEFGIIGCIVFSWVFGWFARNSKKLMFSNNTHYLIIYSMLYPFFFQLVARAFTAQFYHMLFALIPQFIFLIMLRKNKVKSNV